VEVNEAAAIFDRGSEDLRGVALECAGISARQECGDVMGCCEVLFKGEGDAEREPLGGGIANKDIGGEDRETLQRGVIARAARGRDQQYKEDDANFRKQTSPL
jgi:hypothetical protein